MTTTTAAGQKFALGDNAANTVEALERAHVSAMSSNIDEAMYGRLSERMINAFEAWARDEFGRHGYTPDSMLAMMSATEQVASSLVCSMVATAFQNKVPPPVVELSAIATAQLIRAKLAKATAPDEAEAKSKTGAV